MDQARARGVGNKRVYIRVSYMLAPSDHAPAFTWLAVAHFRGLVQTGWCENKDDIPILRKRLRQAIRLNAQLKGR